MVKDGKISYLGMNQYTKQWGRIYTYGGKLLENITQAASRDVLCLGMLAAEERGYEVVLHVHDEDVTETPDTPEYSSDELGRLMTAGAPWTEGLPLAAAGFETYRYRKD
jgi:DNA polymerase